MLLNESLREIAAIQALESISTDCVLGLDFARIWSDWDDEGYDADVRPYIYRMRRLMEQALETDIKVLYGIKDPFGFAFLLYGVAFSVTYKVVGGGFYITYKKL